jgi:hypothetical protein
MYGRINMIDRIKELIDFGCDQNIMVYDENAYKYTVTKKLIHQMVKRTPSSEIIYIPDEDFIYIPFFPIIKKLTDPLYCFGRLLFPRSGLCSYEYVEKLSNDKRMGEYIDYYLNVQKGTLPKNTSCLCIAAPIEGELNANNTILGCC